MKSSTDNTARDVKVRVAAGSTTARGKGYSINQDTALFQKLGGNNILMGVFDGHGQAGHNVSSYAANHLKEQILKQRNRNLQMHEYEQAKNEKLSQNDRDGALRASVSDYKLPPAKPLSLRSALASTALAVERGCSSGRRPFASGKQVGANKKSVQHLID